jgi:Asp/Glu/hydantoin racemase
MKTRKLALIHTVNWYEKVITRPFVQPWLQNNPHVEIINIMDDSLLSESLPNGGPTKEVIRRLVFYFMAAEATGADAIMCTCTTMGLGTRTARSFVRVPAFNIDEPMAKEAISLGNRFGILATVPTSAPATRTLLEAEAKAIGKSIEIKTVINEEAFKNLLAGNTEMHDKLVHGELDKLQHEVDVIVLGQVSLAQIRYKTNVPMLQVGHSGFAHAGKLLATA